MDQMRARSWIRIGQGFTFTLSLAYGALAQPAPPAPVPAEPPVAPGPPTEPPPAEPGRPAPTQPAPVPAQVPTEAKPEPALSPTAPPPAEAPPPASPGEPAPAPAPQVGAQAQGSAEIPLSEPELRPVPAEPAERDATRGDVRWYDAFELRLFADAYLSVNYNFPKPQAGTNGVVRAFDTDNGFALAWVGFDAAYPAEPVGGTVSLRFGPAAERLAAGCLAAPCDADIGLTPVKQAFASWRPGGASSGLRLDFGKFDTIYGAEVADSQDNINYTRGLLYWFAQPAYHTGLRLVGDVSETFSLNALAVNGINNSVDNNVGKSLGVQGTLKLARGDDSLGSISLGYLVGPERDDTKLVECPAGQAFDASNATGCVASPGSSGDSGVVDRATNNTKGLRHLVDLVFTLTPTDELALIVNGDFGLERVRDTLDESAFVSRTWYGVMAGARYALSDAFGVGGRAEYLGDPDGHVTGFPANDVEIVSGTVTLDVLPADYLLVRLDNRVDWSSRELFRKSTREAVGTLVTTTLGVVVTTN